jgi:nicotinate-nucleotide adenylyltransferase
MGGMFDPVHAGHIEVALRSQEKLELDRVLMVPCGIPNHRSRPLGSNEQRLEMLRLATASYPVLRIDDRELRNPGVSYTTDTLSAIHGELPDATLFLIVGMDSFNSLSSWHRWRELFDLCHFVVVSRPGFARSIDPVLSASLAGRIVGDPAEMSRQSHGLVYMADDVEILLSSSQVRAKIEAGARLESMLSPEVIEYVNQHQLYRANLTGDANK